MTWWGLQINKNQRKWLTSEQLKDLWSLMKHWVESMCTGKWLSAKWVIGHTQDLKLLKTHSNNLDEFKTNNKTACNAQKQEITMVQRFKLLSTTYNLRQTKWDEQPYQMNKLWIIKHTHFKLPRITSQMNKNQRIKPIIKDCASQWKWLFGLCTEQGFEKVV